MNMSRKSIGQIVELVWRDPGSNRAPIEKAPKGRAALALWKEYGMIDDVTDGVVRIIHSAGREPGASETDEIFYTVVDEALIESVIVLKPEGTAIQ